MQQELESMDKKPSDSEALSQLRTLMALERNYLAEERTVLAEFRTGLAVTIIGPPSSLVSLTGDWPNWVDYSLLAVFLIITLIGIYTIIRSRARLRILRKNRAQIHKREADIIKNYPNAKNLLLDCMDPYMEIDPKKDYHSPFNSKYE